LCNLTGTNGSATFTDSKLQALINGHRIDQINGNVGVIPRHNHLDSRSKLYFTGNVQGPEVELRTIMIMEGSMTAALFFFQDIYLLPDKKPVLLGKVIGVAVNSKGTPFIPEEFKNIFA